MIQSYKCFHRVTCDWGEYVDDRQVTGRAPQSARLIYVDGNELANIVEPWSMRVN